MGVTSYEIRLTGKVQGVGFRPFVYRLAGEHGLGGTVRNDSQGVVIVIEGDAVSCTGFMAMLHRQLPPLASIETMQTTEREPAGVSSFTIIDSDRTHHKTTPVIPDMSVCERCLQEMHDPSERRYGHWLINCTDCGPRYSIVATVPYDRANTSMAAFGMCPACAKEYGDVEDRRYHAQAIGCYDCGPTLLFHADNIHAQGEAALSEAIESLKKGRIIAVKGMGGFHLMCDATNEQSVRQLRERKRRPFKPFAVMFPDVAAIEKTASITPEENDWLQSAQRPIVLLRKSREYLAPSVAPHIDRVGAMLPYTPLHYRLFESLDMPLVATSANISDEPIIRSDEELLGKLEAVVDGILTHDRPILNACDDSVLQVVDKRPLMLRLARGFTPITLTLPFTVEKSVLAVGANQKATIALAFDNQVIVSPHIGDLETVGAMEYFERTVETFKRFYDVEPDLVVCDRHPGYATNKWAKEQGKPLLEVQHHHAHILAVMAEMQTTEPLLGFVFDGTGYGDDGTIWGGEVMLADTAGFERLYHLAPFRLLGGERAVHEPWRIALALLFELYTLDEVLEMDLELLKSVDEQTLRQLHTAWKKGINAPVCTSMGRLFDGVASLASIIQNVSYEGESGLRLEALVQHGEAAYPYGVGDGVIDWKPMIRAMIGEKQDASIIASRFIMTVAEIMTDIAGQYGRKTALSGGVFQNRTLVERVIKRFEQEQIDYVLPSKFPVNDGAISLGQLWYALQQ